MSDCVLHRQDTHFGVATSRGLGSAPAAAAAGSRLCLPVIALKMADVRGERWLASTFESVLDAQSHFQQWQVGHACLVGCCTDCESCRGHKLTMVCQCSSQMMKFWPCGPSV